MTTSLVSPNVCPHYEDMGQTQAILQKVLDSVPASTRALAREADISPRLLRMIRDGDRRLTSEVRDALIRTLRAWGEECIEAAEALEAADLESPTGGDDA